MGGPGDATRASAADFSVLPAQGINRRSFPLDVSVSNFQPGSYHFSNGNVCCKSMSSEPRGSVQLPSKPVEMAFCFPQTSLGAGFDRRGVVPKHRVSSGCSVNNAH